jgi:WD40 repeat protein
MQFLSASEAEEQRRLAEEEARRKAELARVRRQFMFAFVGFLIAVGLAVWGVIERGRAEAQAQRAADSEQVRTKELFDSNLTHASLLAKGEDFAAADKKLNITRNLNDEVPATRRHARDLLSGFTAIMGGAAEHTYEGAGAALTGDVAISPGGHWLAASGERGTIALFERGSGRLVQKLEGHDGTAGDNGTVWDIVFHPTQPWLFSGGADGQIIRWALPQSGQAARVLQQWEVDDTKVYALALHKDGKVLVSGHGDGKIRVWDIEETPPGLPLSGEEKEAAPKLLRVLEGHTGMIGDGGGAGLAFSPDGKVLASASHDTTVRLWNWQSGETLQVLNEHTAPATGVAFSPDGQWLASSSFDQSIILWDTQSGQQLRRLKGHQNMVFGLQFLDSGLLASASSDNTIRLWDVQTGVTRLILQSHTAAVTGLAVWEEQGQQRLYSASNDGTVKRWGGALPGQWLVGLPGEPFATAISPDGKIVLVGFVDGSLRTYDLATRQMLYEIKDAHKNKIVRLAFDTDGGRFVSGGDGAEVHVWKMEGDGKFSLEKTLEGHDSLIHAVAFSPDGSHLATASYDGRIGLFELEGEGKTLFEAHEGGSVGGVESVSFTLDGKQLLSTGYYDRELKLWDFTVQPPTATTLATAAAALLWGSLSPDGSQLASVGREQTVSVYPTRKDAEPLRLHGHEQVVYKAIFSPDSRQLATVSMDMTVRLWDLDTQSELFRLRLPTEFVASPNSPLWDFDFRCTPTGCWIAVPLTSGKLALYNLGKIKDYSAEEVATNVGSATDTSAADAATPKVDEARILEVEKQYQQAIEKNPKDADALYALARIAKYRKDYDREEDFYKKAIKADPKHVNALTGYAIFLHFIRKDYKRAEPLYRQVIAAVPDNPNTLVNLAQIVLLQGKLEEGRKLINESFGSHPGDAATVELWFYRFVYFPDSYPYAQQEIVDLLKNGVRDEGWDFSANIAQAEKAGHPNVPLLKALADVITNKAKFETLAPYLKPVDNEK